MVQVVVVNDNLIKIKSIFWNTSIMIKTKLFTFFSLMLASYFATGQISSATKAHSTTITEISDSEEKSILTSKQFITVESDFDVTADFSFEKDQSLSHYLKLELQPFVIDTMDSVVFDLFNNTVAGNQVLVPVSFNSNDFTYALDFSIRFNYPYVEFDTLMVVANGLNYLYYFNPNDSTLRFTSYSLGQMINNSTVLMIRLNSTNGFVCINDLNTITGYLNGDKCSYKVTECDTSSLSFNENEILLQESIFYPNPANDKINFKNKNISLIEIINTSGQIMLSKNISKDNKNIEMDITRLNQGIYFVKTSIHENISVRKLLISR